MKLEAYDRENHLLAALPPAELQRLLPLMESIDLPAGEVLRLSGDKTSHVYFPTTAVVSFQQVLESGATAEVAMVGNEGIVGISLLMGGNSSPSSAVVQCAGHAYRLDAQVFKDQFQNSAPTMRLLLLYAQAVFTLTSQTAVCNRYHSLDQQLCRRLLQGLDRTQSNVLALTHECIAHALGVRREGVTAAAGDLRTAGLIQYARGQITVLDRPGLQDRTCECYGVVKSEYDRLLAARPAAAALQRKPALNLAPRKKVLRPAAEPLEVVTG